MVPSLQPLRAGPAADKDHRQGRELAAPSPQEVHWLLQRYFSGLRQISTSREKGGLILATHFCSPCPGPQRCCQQSPRAQKGPHPCGFHQHLSQLPPAPEPSNAWPHPGPLFPAPLPTLGTYSLSLSQGLHRRRWLGRAPSFCSPGWTAGVLGCPVQATQMDAHTGSCLLVICPTRSL